MKQLLLAALVILSACSKQGGSGQPQQPAANNQGGSSDAPARVVIMKAPLKAEIGDAGFVLDESSISLETPRRRYVSRVIMIRNTTITEKAISVDLSGVNEAISAETGCGTVLGPRRSCAIYLSFNRDNEHETGVSIPSSNIQISSGGFSSSVAVTAAVIGDDAESEAEAEIQINKNAISFTSQHFVGKTESDMIIIKNADVESQKITVDTSALANGWSIQNHCPAQLLGRRVCAIEVMHSSASAGSFNSTLTVVGQPIALGAQVSNMPSYDSNPNFQKNTIPSSVTIQEGSAVKSFTMKFTNPNGVVDPLAGNLIYSKDINYGDISLLPEAFKSSNSCPTSLLRNRNCETSFSFDPDMFHFGITTSHNIFLGGDQVALTLKGNSPCNPDHPNARSDAEYGYKLNASKTECVPNVGVYDGADSYYGHAVFE